MQIIIHKKKYKSLVAILKNVKTSSGLFWVIVDTILNSKLQKSLLLQFALPRIVNALDYFAFLHLYNCR